MKDPKGALRFTLTFSRSSLRWDILIPVGAELRLMVLLHALPTGHIAFQLDMGHKIGKQHSEMIFHSFILSDFNGQGNKPLWNILKLSKGPWRSFLTCTQTVPMFKALACQVSSGHQRRYCCCVRSHHESSWLLRNQVESVGSYGKCSPLRPGSCPVNKLPTLRLTSPPPSSLGPQAPTAYRSVSEHHHSLHFVQFSSCLKWEDKSCLIVG